MARRRGISAPLSNRQRSAVTGWGFLTPSLVIIGGFLLMPLVIALTMSLQDFSFRGDSPWAGLKHYERLISDPAFWNALLNTAYYAILTIPASIGLGLLMALILNTPIRGRQLFRVAFFLPVIAPLAIAAIPWRFLMDPDVGWAYQLLASAGIRAGGWVRDPTWAMPAVAIVGIWKTFGFYMLLYLAGLQTIPRSLHEAAIVDGATRLRRFRDVTWPLLSNTTLFVVVVAAIGALQAFDQIFVMTRGGPFFKTETIVTMIYRVGFVNFDFSYAGALSMVLLAVILALSLIQIGYFSRREVVY